jgi:hypothetical protein
MSKYKLIQLTNNNIDAVAANAMMPLGTVTRRINASASPCTTFEVTSTTSDIVYINEPGYYKVTYSASLTAAAAGTVGMSLVANQNTVYSVSEEATAAEDIVNLTLVYVIRVCPNSCATPYNCPTSIQMKLGDVAISNTPSPSVANLIIERVY